MNQPASRLAGKSVLVVEDEYFIADDLRRALLGAGADVIGPVPSVEAGMEALQGGGIDAAVLDINLNGEMSYPVADCLAKRHIPFLLTTGYDEQAIPERFRSAPRLAKPFTAAIAVQVLEDLSVEMPTGGAVS